MCGFVAGYKPNLTKEEIISSLNTILHRGPDGNNFTIIKNTNFLAHSRLAIVGDYLQPISNEDNSIFAVVNGEFYLWEKIAKQLKSKNHLFKTNTDSEILIHLYEEYKFNCLKFLRGEFSFVLYDKKNDLWFIAKDRFGTKPLNYFLNNDSFLVSSEAKALFSFNLEKKLNKDSLFFSQHFQYLPLNDTLFKNIHTIAPGFYAVIKNHKIDKYNYWQKEQEENKLNKINSFHEASDQIIEILNESVKIRIPQVNWATHLSGGIDSSIVSLLASQNSKKNIDCFTVSFTDDQFYNELFLAQKMADFIGARLNVVEVDYAKMLSVLPRAIYHAEGLTINGHLGAKYLLNQEIKNKNFKVALSGEGSDELLMGYSHLKNDYLGQVTQMEQSYLHGIQLPSSQILNNNLNQKFKVTPTWIMAKLSIAYKLSHFWSKDFYSNFQPEQIFFNETRQSIRLTRSNLRNAANLWIKYCLSGYILKVLDDAQSMAHSIEGRLPFLDTEVALFTNKINNKLFFKNNIEKAILRHAFKNRLPPEIINKTKQSFMAPPLQNAFKIPQNTEFIYDHLFNKYFLELNLFDKNKINLFLTKLQNDFTPEMEPVLMTLLSIAILSKEFKLSL